MIFQDVITAYIDYCRKEAHFTKRSLERYQYILLVFSDFLFNEHGLNDISVFTFLRGITHKEVLTSLDFYIKKYNVKAEDTVLFYVSVIKEYLRYLVKIKAVDNSNVIASFGLSDTDANAFNYHCLKHIDILIKRGTISESSDGAPLNEEQINSVTGYCNKNLMALDVGRCKMNKDSYNRYVNALITKIVIMTGVSVADRVFDLQVKHLNMESGYILINEYPVYFSFNLRNQFTTYLDKVYKGDISDPDSLLFAQYSGKKIEQPNIIGGFLKNALKKLDIYPIGFKPSSTICLAKYAIIQLIDLGIDRDTIALFTGYKDTVLSSCKNYADAGKEIESREILSNALKLLPIFNTL